jgi:hypothetical protein
MCIYRYNVQVVFWNICTSIRLAAVEKLACIIAACTIDSCVQAITTIVLKSSIVLFKLFYSAASKICLQTFNAPQTGAKKEKENKNFVFWKEKLPHIFGTLNFTLNCFAAPILQGNKEQFCHNRTNGELCIGLPVHLRCVFLLLSWLFF